MKSELVLLGCHFAMGQRSRRRKLVVIVYLGVAALVVGLEITARSMPSWAVPQIWLPIFFVPILLNSFVFGGFARWGRGLVKPFFGNETLNSYGINQEARRNSAGSNYLENIYQNDERDLRRRNDAHWRAYRYMYPAVAFPFFLAFIEKPLLSAGWASNSTFEILLCCVSGSLFCVYPTLPQAILLWTEPDMD